MKNPTLPGGLAALIRFQQDVLAGAAPELRASGNLTLFSFDPEAGLGPDGPPNDTLVLVLHDGAGGRLGRRPAVLRPAPRA